nr:LLM class flavin-dependent oxidoreductase [uncultured Pedobacter sp.]
MRKINLGVLEMGSRDNLMCPEITECVIEEAVLLEELGYFKIWYTEHYVPSLNSGWLNPEVIVPLVAAHTEKIKVGIAGALVLYHSAFSLACNYKLLNNLFHKRIELGIAKGLMPYCYEEAFGIFSSKSAEENRNRIGTKMSKLANYLHREKENLDNGIVIPPFGGVSPELWNLTSSEGGYIDCLEYGYNCSRTLFHNNANLHSERGRLEKFRSDFLDKFQKPPLINIAVAGTCSPNQITVDYTIANLNIFINAQTLITGCKERVCDEILRLSEEYKVDEVIFLEISNNRKNRKRSLEDIASILC